MSRGVRNVLSCIRTRLESKPGRSGKRTGYRRLSGDLRRVDTVASKNAPHNIPNTIDPSINESPILSRCSCYYRW
jgi:hypothetical protein